MLPPIYLFLAVRAVARTLPEWFCYSS